MENFSVDQLIKNNHFYNVFTDNILNFETSKASPSNNAQANSVSKIVNNLSFEIQSKNIKSYSTSSCCQQFNQKNLISEHKTKEAQTQTDAPYLDTAHWYQSPYNPFHMFPPSTLLPLQVPPPPPLISPSLLLLPPPPPPPTPPPPSISQQFEPDSSKGLEKTCDDDNDDDGCIVIDQRHSKKKNNSNKSHRHLPPGWKCKRSDKGKTFYFNVNTKKSQWKFPTWCESEDVTGTTTVANHVDLDDSSLKIIHHSKEEFRNELKSFIVKLLEHYSKSESCKYGLITNKDDFKHLARKFTHTILEKELTRSLANKCHTLDLDLNEHKRVKVAEYVASYMKKFPKKYSRKIDDFLKDIHKNR
jgi:hypothetical protein